jgi:hypothetical protein
MNESLNFWMLMYDVEGEPWVLGFKWNGGQTGRVAQLGGCCSQLAE